MSAVKGGGYKEKYLKYKNKYIQLKNLVQEGGDPLDDLELEWKKKEEKLFEENKHLLPKIKEKLKAENIEKTKEFILETSGHIKSLESQLQWAESKKTEPQSFDWNKKIEEYQKELELNKRFLELARKNGIIYQNFSYGNSPVVISWEGLGLKQRITDSEPEKIITVNML